MEENVNLPIPTDILFEILSRIPPKSVLRFKRVCKRWCSLIRDPTFVDFQLHQAKKSDLVLITKLVHSQRCTARSYSINIHGIATEVYPPIESSSYIDARSCNGLICFRESNSSTLKVCNPIIQKRVTLPQPICFGDDNVWSRIGFGYDTRSRKYKVAGWISTCWPDIEVFTLGESWTKIKTTEDMHYPSFYPAQIIYANGTLYWTNRFDRRMQRGEQLPRCKIFSLSLADDTFRMISGPDVDVTHCFCYNLLCEVESSLCLVHLDRNDTTMMNLWLLQDSDKQLWVRQQIRLQFPFSIELKWVWANSIIIQTSETEISVKAYHEGNFYSCLYDKQGRLLKENKVIELQSAPWIVADVYTHVGNLLSFYAMQEHMFNATKTIKS